MSAAGLRITANQLLEELQSKRGNVRHCLAQSLHVVVCLTLYRTLSPSFSLAIASEVSLPRWSASPAFPRVPERFNG